MVLETESVMRKVHSYWNELLHSEAAPPMPEEFMEYLYAVDTYYFSYAIVACTPTEIDTIMNSEDENALMLEMLKVYTRYIDLCEGRTIIDEDHLYFTNETSIYELKLSDDDLKELSKRNILMIGAIPGSMCNLSYELCMRIMQVFLDVGEGRALQC